MSQPVLLRTARDGEGKAQNAHVHRQAACDRDIGVPHGCVALKPARGAERGVVYWPRIGGEAGCDRVVIVWILLGIVPFSDLKAN